MSVDPALLDRVTAAQVPDPKTVLIGDLLALATAQDVALTGDQQTLAQVKQQDLAKIDALTQANADQGAQIIALKAQIATLTAAPPVVVPPPPPNQGPVWQTIPVFTATVGFPVSIDLNPYVKDPGGNAMTFTETGNLPAGWTYDATKNFLNFDGTGVPGSSGVIQVFANDGQP